MSNYAIQKTCDDGKVYWWYGTACGWTKDVAKAKMYNADEIADVLRKFRNPRYAPSALNKRKGAINEKKGIIRAQCLWDMDAGASTGTPSPVESTPLSW